MIGKKAAVLLSLILMAGSLAMAADTKIDKPRSNEVILVFRLQIGSTFDHDFYANYASFTSPWVSAKLPRGFKNGELPKDSFQLVWVDVARNIQYSTYENDASGLRMLKISIPKDREIDLEYFRYYICDSNYLFFDLPIFRKIVVPEGSNYVYVGTFTYKFSNEYFEVSDIALSDEYDGAEANVAKTFGDKARLVRVNLIKLDDTKK